MKDAVNKTARRPQMQSNIKCSNQVLLNLLMSKACQYNLRNISFRASSLYYELHVGRTTFDMICSQQEFQKATSQYSTDIKVILIIRQPKLNIVVTDL